MRCGNPSWDAVRKRRSLCVDIEPAFSDLANMTLVYSYTFIEQQDPLVMQGARYYNLLPYIHACYRSEWCTENITRMLGMQSTDACAIVHNVRDESIYRAFMLPIHWICNAMQWICNANAVIDMSIVYFQVVFSYNVSVFLYEPLRWPNILSSSCHRHVEEKWTRLMCSRGIP